LLAVGDVSVNVPVYPGAIERPLKDHSEMGTVAQRNLIVPHITGGPTAESAINTFEASVHPNRVSAHFVIDRDAAATVYQLLPISDTAWHASAVNERSIGIEHAAIPGTLMATDAQYAASAKLIAWLCGQLKIPCDREHIQGHNQCSPQDHHTLCPSGALDVDRLAQLARDFGLYIQP
jgi:N-acetyl-anhydromuramyl-L-alanine amidase AmpD